MALGKTTQEAQIRSVIEDWASAMRAKDARRVVSHGTADFIQFSLAPPLVATDAGEKGLAAWFANWQGPLGYEFNDLRIVADENVAFAHGLTRLTGTDTDGEKVELWFRQTLGLRKVGGVWKIAHGHESVPFYMDGSYRAAIDLKP
jgi:PhnB protein